MWGVQLTALLPFYRMTWLGNNVRRQCQMNTLKSAKGIVFCRFGSFLPFDPSNNPENKNFKKNKKKHLEILSFYTCVPQMMIIWCMVPEISSTTDNFLSFRASFALLPPLQPRKSKFLKKMKKLLEYQTWKSYCPFTPLPPSLTTQRIKILKKTPGDILIFHKCTINENHMIYGSWHMKCTLKNKNFRKMKKIPGGIIILH